MDTYPTSDAKLALAVNSAKLAKNANVAEHGIGEEIPHTLLGWRQSRLAVVTQATTDVMRLDPTERLTRIAKAAFVFRRGWGATALTLVAEGFCLAPHAPAGDPTPLPVRFANGDPDVHECLNFIHAEFGGGHIIGAVPFRYGVPRTVTYPMDLLVFRDVPATHPYIHMMARALDHEVTRRPDQAALVAALATAGLVTFSSF